MADYDQTDRYVDLGLEESELIAAGRHVLCAYVMKPRAGTTGSGRRPISRPNPPPGPTWPWSPPTTSPVAWTPWSMPSKTSAGGTA